VYNLCVTLATKLSKFDPIKTVRKTHCDDDDD